MAQNIHLNVILPKDRNHSGWLRVEVNGRPMAEFRVLGRGSATVKGKPTGNPTRNPFLNAGDTPTGEYQSQGLVDTGDWDRASYGPWGAVRLRAFGGNALVAEKLGRTGLLIHGGAPGAFDGFRPTLGCLRISNLDMFTLRNTLFAEGENSIEQICDDLSVTVTVRDQ